jgi:YfiH family protein
MSAVSATVLARGAADVPYLTFAGLADEPRLAHGVSTRAGGVSDGPYASLNLSLTVGDERERVLENRRRLASAIASAPLDLYGARQVHGASVAVVDTAVRPEVLARESYDILLSGAPGRLLFLKFADCTPVLLWDPEHAWVGLAHAGWRGTAVNAAATAVRALVGAAGSRPPVLWAAIGPAIGGCCYEVGPEVAEAVGAAVPQPAAVLRPGRQGKSFLDLAAANRQQLLAAGVAPERVLLAGRCTACEVTTFFSHRALGYPAGRFAVVAGVRP